VTEQNDDNAECNEFAAQSRMNEFEGSHTHDLSAGRSLTYLVPSSENSHQNHDRYDKSRNSKQDDCKK
jgi:hypothetical protein